MAIGVKWRWKMLSPRADGCGKQNRENGIDEKEQTCTPTVASPFIIL